MVDDASLSKLRSLPLFSDLHKREVRSLAETGKEVEVPAGFTMIHQGMEGTDFYVILSGAVEVAVDGRPVASLGPGDHFGELSAITGEPRSASVTATERVFALRLNAESLERFLQKHGEAAYRILVVACRRLQRAAPTPAS